MAEAFAVVKVGNSAWLLRRLTPSRAIAAMVGAVRSSTMRERKPSATNSTTLCGREAGAWADAADNPIVVKAVVTTRSGRRIVGSQAVIMEGYRQLMPTAYDDRVTRGTPFTRNALAQKDELAQEERAPRRSFLSRKKGGLRDKEGRQGARATGVRHGPRLRAAVIIARKRLLSGLTASWDAGPIQRLFAFAADRISGLAVDCVVANLQRRFVHAQGHNERDDFED